MTPITQFNGEYRYLSNFWRCNLDAIEVAGELLTPLTVEHAYQAAKFLDDATRKYILTAPGPAEAKKLGQGGLIRSDWDSVKFEAMDTFIAQKFSDLNPQLCLALVATGDAMLVEGNTWGDTIWGVCRGVGQNHLGKLLMRRRDELQGKA